MKMFFQSLQCILLFLSLGYFTNAQESYVAVVMEYGLNTDTSISDLDNVLSNTREMQLHIERARTDHVADIIVFPEYSLTSPNLPNDLENISTIVPIPSEDAVPCMRSRHSYADFFVILSCAAFQHQIHVVVNVIEKANSTTNTTIYYNTNVVFDNRGAVIARYRKINLINEDVFTPGEDVTVFTTSFGVTFGLLSTADILHKNPLEILMNDLRVTDLIYTNSWHSETPFFKGLSLQDGVAKAYGVNLLASGYSSPRNGTGGAGIFLADASTVVDLSLITVQNRLSSRINIITTRTPASVCEHDINIVPRIGGQLPTIDNFGLNFENMELYTFAELELGINQTTGEVCSEGSDFCCEYDITFNSPLTNISTIYKVAAFYGIRSFSNSPSTLGVRTCALVACQNDDSTSCSMRPSRFNVDFSRVTIKTRVPMNEDTSYRPATLNSALLPLSLYTYCQGSVENGQVEIVMTIERTNDIMAFGIFGRVYNLDGGEVGRGFGSSIKAVAMLTLSTIVASFLI